MIKHGKVSSFKMKKNVLLVMLLAFVMICSVACAPKKTSEKPKGEETNFITNIEDVTWVQCSNGEKTATVEYTDEAWFLEGNKEDWITQSGVESMIEAANKLTPIKEVQNPKALSEYGLDKPAYTITMKNEAGDEVTLYIGAVIPVEGATTTETTTETATTETTTTDTATTDATTSEGEETEKEEVKPKECYATVGNKDKVYVISATIIDTLLSDAEELIVEEVDPLEALKNMVIEGEEEDAIVDDSLDVIPEEENAEGDPIVDAPLDGTEGSDESTKTE